MGVVKNLMVRAGADFSELKTKLKGIEKTLKTAGKNMSSVGKTLTTGLTVPIVGAAAAIGGLAVKAGQNADDLITMSNKTGISTKALQELSYAARFVDVDVETMTDSMFKMTQRMADAKDGTGAQAEAFAALGVAVTNQDGTLRNAKTVWQEAITALGGVANETERDALAYDLFGRSAQELNPLIVAGGDELARLATEANNVGAVMSGESVTALGKFDDQMQKIQAVLATAGGELGAAFLPLIEKLTPIIQEQIIPAIAGFADKVGSVVDKFMALSPETQGFILTALGIVVAIGPVLSMIGTLTTLISGLGVAFTLLSGPVGIVIAIIAAFIAIGILVYKNWDVIKAWLIEAWENIKTTATNTWTAIKDFFAGLWDGMKNTATTVWTAIKDFFAGIWEGISTAATSAWNGIKGFFTSIWDGIKTVFKTYTDGIKQVFDIFSDVFSGDWEGAWNGIKDFFSDIWNGIVNIAENAVNGIVKAVNKAIKWINKVPGINIGTIGEADFSGANIQKHADGGVFTRPTMWGNHLIGESGPEALVPLDRMGGSANIIVELDGRTIASVVGQPLVDLIRVKTGVRI